MQVDTLENEELWEDLSHPEVIKSVTHHVNSSKPPIKGSFALSRILSIQDRCKSLQILLTNTLYKGNLEKRFDLQANISKTISTRWNSNTNKSFFLPWMKNLNMLEEQNQYNLKLPKKDYSQLR